MRLEQMPDATGYIYPPFKVLQCYKLGKTEGLLGWTLSKILCQEIVVVEFGFKALVEAARQSGQVADDARARPAPFGLVELVG